MYLRSYRVQNFRRLQSAHIELDSDISIFVGSNNSGKTSATQAIQTFLSGSKERFSLYDFSSSVWKKLNEIGEADPSGDDQASMPCVVLDLWFEVTQDDLYLVIPLLPSTQWQGNEVGIRIEFGARDAIELLQRYRGKQKEAKERAAALVGGAGNYIPWPKTLTEYLEKELHREFELRYFVLDRTQFDSEYRQSNGYEPSLLAGELGGGALLKSLVRVDCLNAQRHLTDPKSNTSGGAGRAEDLSKRLSRFYQRNLDQREEDHAALKALFDSEEGLNKHLMEVFEPTLKQLETLGYPGLNNPRLEIKSALNPATIMSQDAKVHYIVGSGDSTVTLPDSYNGLGFKNLIYMVVEILDLHQKWKEEEDKRPPLHLIFIEEPEAHLHAQLQQVFIRNVFSLLNDTDNAGESFASQVVVTTHSPHILYERGFTPIRYFRRHNQDGEQSTKVLNLSSFQKGPTPKDRDFLQRYLKLTHCDLFFADAAILVEGNVERLLMPSMIEKESKTLRSAAICILEVGGAFGHRFKELIEFLGITTLIITDIDSVTEASAPDVVDEDEEKEFEIPSVDENAPPQKRYGRTCLPAEPGAVTANQTLIQWLPKMRTIEELLAASCEQKTEKLGDSDMARVMVAYQTSTEVTWNDQHMLLCGRTLEEAFGLENAAWCQEATQRYVGLKLKAVPASPNDLAIGLYKRVTGKHFDKTKFALAVLSSNPEHWSVPLYIKQGLIWLAAQIGLEAESNPQEGTHKEIIADALAQTQAAVTSIVALTEKMPVESIKAFAETPTLAPAVDYAAAVVTDNKNKGAV
ncbi:putative ATP-dependent endonuclease of OLD family [Paucimonas lemoignei]|uniref:Putative ATP-dependent endonuclease of OLD family n=1 Tax=Paucimonas lemoignei TaxID=29443 RepID=A0A4R3HVV7_PAULE|nr:ATP-dependent endonuclease [Paucimonas lemoignei]TCS35167.1 putative ATP-dependent endonuclease of OLD family [Paucimonas lemoignei]